MRFVAARRLARGQHHSRFRGKNIDHLQRRVALAALVGPSHGFAVDRHHAGKLDPIGLGKRRSKLSKGLREGFRIEVAEDAAERIVAGNAVLQPQELPQQRFLGAAEQLHIGCAFRSAQHRSQRDNQDVEQLVQRIRRTRIGQAEENLGEFRHRTPHAIWESLSKSTLPADAT